ncbi:hypothetical protein [Falsiroseomonas sp.]|uniref:hypothetical protein n=1 Tax=Falsiroseomonas sp. TaxID=2870721 RepID=UPI0035682604
MLYYLRVVARVVALLQAAKGVASPDRTPAAVRIARLSSVGVSTPCSFAARLCGPYRSDAGDAPAEDDQSRTRKARRREMTDYTEINFDVDVDVYKDINVDVYSNVDLDGWTADAGADAVADADGWGYFTMAEAYTDAYTTIGYSEASSFSAAAIDYWC